MLIIISVFTSCNKTPENIKNKEHYSNSEVSFNKEYINVEGLKESSQQALNNNYNQLKVSKVNKNIPTELHNMEFIQISNFEGRYKEVFDSFLEKFNWQTNSITKQKSKDGLLSCSFSNENKKIYGCVSDNGFISFLAPECYDDPFVSTAETVKIYHIDRDDDDRDIYHLSDGDCSVKEAKDYVLKWVNEKYKKYDPEFDYQIKTIIAKKAGNTYCYDITVQQLYKGVVLDNLAIVNDKNNTKHLKFIMHKLRLTMHKKSEISSFTNGCGIIKPAIKGNVEKVMSLESALKICQNKFTAYNEIKITDICVKYSLEPQYSNDDPYDSYYYAGKKFKSHVYWEFVIDVPHDQILKSGDTDTFGDVRKYIYVDMQSGEIEFDFEGVLQ